MSELLLINAAILTMDSNLTVYAPGYLWVKGSKIEKIGPMSELPTNGLSRDCLCMNCSKKIITPGFVNTHSHLSMIVFRSLADDVPDRLKRYMLPLEMSAMNQEMAAAGARYAFAELLSGGVTTVHDAYYFEDSIAREAKACGIRGVFAETVMKGKSPNAQKPYDGITYTEKFLKQWADDPLIRPAVNCHAIYTNDTDHLKHCHGLARDYGVLMSMHVAEMDFEHEGCVREYGRTPVGYLDECGILDEHFLAAHSVLVNEDDLDIYQRRGVKVSYNPGANAKSAKGVMPLKAMCGRGITVGLGSDGPMSGNTIDILTQMPLVGKIQKLFGNDRTLFPAWEILRMATIGGAKALGLGDETGSLEQGKKADIVIFETDSLNMNPIYDYASVIVYSANPANVETTIVDGKMLMHKRKLLTLEADKVRMEIVKYHDEIFGKAQEIDKNMC